MGENGYACAVINIGANVDAVQIIEILREKTVFVQESRRKPVRFRAKPLDKMNVGATGKFLG